MKLSTNTRSIRSIGAALALTALALAPTQAHAQCTLQQDDVIVDGVFGVATLGGFSYSWDVTYNTARSGDVPYITFVYFQKPDGAPFSADPENAVLVRDQNGNTISGKSTWTVTEGAFPDTDPPVAAVEFAFTPDPDNLLNEAPLWRGETFVFSYATEFQEPLRIYAVNSNDEVVFDQVFTEANCTLLPVELVAFNATIDDGAALLRWRTATEQNNAGFEVQHAAPGADAFRDLGFVEGHGTTTEVQDYAFRIESLAPGTHRFRLKQVDFDGAVHFGPVLEVAVELPEQAHLSAAYPNPFNPQTQFTLEVKEAQQVRLAVFDALGRRVALLHDGMLEAGTAHPFRFEAAALPSGMYLIRAQGEVFSQTRRVTLLK